MESTGLQPPQRADEIGRLAHYRVLALLGAGGMGAVYKAEDTRLRRLVALKVMLPEQAANPTARQRFVREARTAAQVESDHIVHIHEVNEVQGTVYLVMPLLKGESLADRIKREGTLTLSEALRITREAALGLAAAHKRRLVHRDIKPANIWLEAGTGRVKILDFGLARPAVATVEASTTTGIDAANLGPQLTQAGSVMGTPAYMSPEQATGEPLDARSDLWSLGVVLYQMVTGRLPFPGKSMKAVLTAIANQDPPAPITVNPNLPIAINDLILGLLNKQPDDRPSPANEVARRLADLAAASTAVPLAAPIVEPTPADETFAQLDDETRGARPPRRPPPKRSGNPALIWMAVIAVGLLALGGIAWGVMGGKSKTTTQANENLAKQGGTEPAKQVSKPVAKPSVVVDVPAPKTIELPVAGLGDTTVLTPLAAPANWQKAGVFAEVHGRGTLAFPTLPATSFVLEADLEVRGPGELAFAFGDTAIGHPELRLLRIANEEGARASLVHGFGNSPISRESLALTMNRINLRVMIEPIGTLYFHGDVAALATSITATAGVRIEGLAVDTDATIRTCRLRAATAEERQTFQKQHTSLIKAAAKVAGILPPVKLITPEYRKAAEWVISAGDNSAVEVTVNDNFAPSRTTNPFALPRGNFMVSGVELRKITPDRLEQLPKMLKPLESIDVLRLQGTDWTDRNIARALTGLAGLTVKRLEFLGLPAPLKESLTAFAGLRGLQTVYGAIDPAVGFKPLAGLTDLDLLGIGGPQNTDATLATAASLPASLRFLSMNGSAITDTGLARLAVCKQLRLITVKLCPKVTAAGVKALAAKLPQCWIDWDGGTTEPKPEGDFALRFHAKAGIQIPEFQLDPSKPFTLELFATADEIPSRESTPLGHPDGLAIEIQTFASPVPAWRFKWAAFNGSMGSAPVQPGRRTHIAAVHDNGQVQLFIDGKQTDVRAGFQFPASAAKFTLLIGSGFVGIIDEARVSQSARYTDNFQPAARFDPDKETLGLWHFDEGNGRLLMDSSGHGSHGLILGATWVTPEGKGVERKKQ